MLVCCFNLTHRVIYPLPRFFLSAVVQLVPLAVAF